MEENNNNDEVLEITENEEGSNDGIKIANDVVAVIACLLYTSDAADD